MHLVDATMFYCTRGGGVKRYLSAKHAWLASNAAHVRHTLLVPKTSPESPCVESCGGPAIPLIDGYRFPLSRSRWRKALVSLRPDLIEAGDPYVPAWAARDAGQRLGIPVVAFFHSDLPRMLARRGGRWIERPAGAYLRSLYSGCDLVLAPSRAMLAALGEIGVRHAALQPLGVDTEIFHPSRRDPALRRELGLAPDTRLLIYAGRFAREKNLPVLIDSVRRLGAPYHLLLAGGKAAARIDPQVTVLAYQKTELQMARLLASSDALVHAGNQETFGLILVEAMACGLPVVAVAGGGVSELLEGGEGLLVQQARADDMASAITALFEMNRVRLGVLARERVLRCCSWAAAFRQLLRHYAQLRGAPIASAVPLASAEH